MRLVAILAVLVFGALATLFCKLGISTYKNEKAGETPVSPSWIGFGVAFCLAIMACLCFIYAIGLWDAFVEWGQFQDQGPVVIKQF